MATFTSGNDTRNLIGQGTADVIDALEGQDFVSTGNLNDSVLGGQGDDTLFDVGGTNTLDGGTGNDSIRVTDSVGLLFGNDGGDTINAVGSFGVTIAGGRDSSDAADSLVGSSFNDFILGNGGADIINGGGGSGVDTLVGGFGTDSILAGNAADLIWGNESNDTIFAGAGENSVWGGLGDDAIATGGGLLFGNENNDTLVATGTSTIDGGTGNDIIVAANGVGGTFLGGAGFDSIVVSNLVTATGGDDGDVFGVQNAGTSGTARITDLNWANDQLDVLTGLSINAVGNVGPTDGNNLEDAANRAINQVSGAQPNLSAAAQFVFAGRTWVAVDQFGADFTAETIVDITGVTGRIDTGSFLT